MLLIDKVDDHYLLSLAFNKASIRDPEKTLKQLRAINDDVQVQLLKADLVAGPEHLQLAARNALYSFKGKRRRSKSLAMELLLYVSCQRQISKAIKLLGVDPRDSRIAVVALSDSQQQLGDLAHKTESIIEGKLDDKLFEIETKQRVTKLQRAYGITTKETEGARFEGESDASVLTRLIVERSALLEVED